MNDIGRKWMYLFFVFISILIPVFFIYYIINTDNGDEFCKTQNWMSENRVCDIDIMNSVMFTAISGFFVFIFLTLVFELLHFLISVFSWK